MSKLWHARDCFTFAQRGEVKRSCPFLCRWTEQAVFGWEYHASLTFGELCKSAVQSRTFHIQSTGLEKWISFNITVYRLISSPSSGLGVKVHISSVQKQIWLTFFRFGSASDLDNLVYLLLCLQSVYLSGFWVFCISVPRSQHLFWYIQSTYVNMNIH